MDKIIASTLDNDWCGSIALDDEGGIEGILSFKDYAVKHGYIEDSDHILRFQVNVTVLDLYVCLSYCRNMTRQNKNPTTETVEFNIPIVEFFELFSRASFIADNRRY